MGGKGDRGFNFLTLIELIAVDSFRRLGLNFNKIQKAHEILIELTGSMYPFATSRLLSDGRTIFLDDEKSELLGIDNKLQYSFKELVKPYCEKLEFNEKTKLAERYFPLGKKHSIVVDPHHNFGQPTIKKTNISVQAIVNLLKAGESKEFISNIYNLKISEIEDVIEFSYSNAA